jgi:hypothetical protein
LINIGLRGSSTIKVLSLPYSEISKLLLPSKPLIAFENWYGVEDYKIFGITSPLFIYLILILWLSVYIFCPFNVAELLTIMTLSKYDALKLKSFQSIWIPPPQWALLFIIEVIYKYNMNFRRSEFLKSSVIVNDMAPPYCAASFSVKYVRLRYNFVFLITIAPPSTRALL